MSPACRGHQRQLPRSTSIFTANVTRHTDKDNKGMQELPGAVVQLSVTSFLQTMDGHVLFDDEDVKQFQNVTCTVFTSTGSSPNVGFVEIFDNYWTELIMHIIKIFPNWKLTKIFKDSITQTWRETKCQ